MRPYCISLFLIVLSLGVASTSYAQTAAATINGTLTDSAGASVPDAQVTITNQGTGTKTDTRTNSDGTFSMTGFAEWNVPGHDSEGRFPNLQ